MLSEVGTILVITNYTGDCLHFRMAYEKANASGFQKGPVVVLNCGDDVVLGRAGTVLLEDVGCLVRYLVGFQPSDES